MYYMIVRMDLHVQGSFFSQSQVALSAAAAAAAEAELGYDLHI